MNLELASKNHLWYGVSVITFLALTVVFGITFATYSTTPKTSSVNGITITISSIQKLGDQTQVTVCYPLPDDGDWTIWKASLQYTQGSKTIELADFGFAPVELREFPANGRQRITIFGKNGAKHMHFENALANQQGLRCDRLTFTLMKNAAPTNTMLTIQAIGAYPREGEICGVYLEKAQAMLKTNYPGLQAQCIQNAWGGGLTVAAKPDSMSQTEAEAIIASDKFFTIQGPWVFMMDMP